jgi:hypothetical protein
VIDVSTFPSRGHTADLAKLAIDLHQIDQRSPRPQLDQADFILPALYCAAKHLTVEAQHAVEVDNTKYKMIDFANTDHGRILVGG